MFDDYVNLRPLKGVAEILAQDDSWNTLYDVEKLAKNEVKVTAATQVSFFVNIKGLFTDVEPYPGTSKTCKPCQLSSQST